MEVVILILIIIFAVSNKNKKNQKGRAAGKTPAARMNAPRGAAARTGRPSIPVKTAEGAEAEPPAEVSFEDALAEMRRKLEGRAATARRPAAVAAAPAPEQGESLLADEDCKGGSMPHAHIEGHSALEDEDCIGGSMAHSHTEGVSRAAHARRMAAIDAGHDSDDVLAETIDAQALRRAVVMAEVLGKPRALQMRRRAG